VEYKTWLELLRKTGDSQIDYDGMTMEQINQQVFGLSGGNSALPICIKIIYGTYN